MEILSALDVRLTEGEQATIRGKVTDNLEAYLKVLQALEYSRHGSKQGLLLARQMAEEAIALDPEYARPYRILAGCHIKDVWLGFSKSPKKSLERALEMAQKAISLDESDPCGYETLSIIYMFKRQHERAIAEAERAIALDPNGADAHSALGIALACAGRQQEAIAPLEKAIRMNPIAPSVYFLRLSLAYRDTGRYEEAIAAQKKAITLAPDNHMAHLRLASTYSLAGRDEEARAEVAEVLRIQPKFSLERLARGVPYKNKADMDRVIDALRKAGLPEKPPLPLPDKPSIAVLPFANMSGDPKQEYFSDGMTEELITALSKVPYMFVIARNSTFSYKGKPVKIRQVAEELGVRYVLEGSFRKIGDKVRVAAQLIDAIKGHHLWAERYERELKDIFALQDEITMKILRALEVKLTEGEQSTMRRKGTDNLEAYLKALQALEYYNRMNKEGNLLARQMAEEAIALDPEYARPYRILAGCHLLDLWFGLSKSPKKSLEQAVEMAQKAISLDESHPCGYEILSGIYMLMRQHEKAIAEAERAIALDPNGADAYSVLGIVLIYAGRQQEAIAPLEKAIRINPIAPSKYFKRLGIAYRDTGRYEEAIAQLKKAINRSPDSLLAHLTLTATYSLAGRDEEARAEASEVLRIQPKFSLERLAKTVPYKNKADRDRVIDALRKAGLK
jgi:TolB-like protein/Tfp pilus assembly protein PilF